MLGKPIGKERDWWKRKKTRKRKRERETERITGKRAEEREF